MSYTTTDRQEGLNKLITDKIHNMSVANQNGINAALTKLVEEGRIMRDFIAPIGINREIANKPPVITFSANGTVQMVVNRNQPEVFNLHENAIGQLGEKLGIPTRYLKNLASGDEKHRFLAQQILNEHTSWTDRSRVLIRSVGSEVRGVLSDQYRRLDSMQILQGFFQMIEVAGGMLNNGYMNDTRMYFEALFPKPIVVDTERNGTVIVAFGVRISSSDYGAGALDLRSFVLNGACLNGMVRESVLRQVHLGSKLPDNLALSNETYRLDTETQTSAVKDLTKHLFSEETFHKHSEEIKRASTQEIDLQRELKLLAKGTMLKDEVEEVTRIITNGKPEDGVSGENTLWKLVNGITAKAREATPERGRELQEIAGNLMNRVAI